ncbi:hypothetical protein H072_10769 [Dactylellina haptotyla CBS 200.50]|uniref:F-box domain-containing protein n=1 Tax=Dactylellina haptotyla (strain CBS 200.50) TaxID=1284197 RepID=S7ZZG2_DACHA|nr:hypothetical protein H072_10769 [Dactylellina haptotyla CBS 200.50]
MPISMLPNELLSWIFSNRNLDNRDRTHISQVCTRWAAIVLPDIYRRCTVNYPVKYNLWNYTDFQACVKHGSYVKSLSLWFHNSEDVVDSSSEVKELTKTIAKFPQVTTFSITDKYTNLPWWHFWKILNCSIKTMPNMRCLTIRRHLTNGHIPLEKHIPRINISPARLQQLEEVTIYILVESDNAAEIFYHFMRLLIKVLGDVHLRVKFKIDVRLRKAKGIRTNFNKIPQTWSIKNLEELSFKGSGVYLPGDLITADFSKVKMLKIQDIECKDLMAEVAILFAQYILYTGLLILPVLQQNHYGDKGNLRLSDFENVEVFEINNYIPANRREIGTWSRVLNHLPKIREFRFADAYSVASFMISRSPDGLIVDIKRRGM